MDNSFTNVTMVSNMSHEMLDSFKTMDERKFYEDIIKNNGTKISNISRDIPGSYSVLDPYILSLNQYPVIHKFSFKNESQIEMIQRFLVQLSEEIEEYKFEAIKCIKVRDRPSNIDSNNYTELKNSALSELSDVILYLSSLRLSMKYHSPKIPGVLEDYMEYYENNHISVNYKNMDEATSIIKKYKLQKLDNYNSYCLVMNDLLYMGIRRKYPERKYHKHLKSLTIEEEETRSQNVLDIIDQAIFVTYIYGSYITNSYIKFNQNYMSKYKLVIENAIKFH